jgi:nicotinate-nucleotide adenylyltransferase
MKVGLFFGSFNPVHVGHMIIANYMVEYTPIQKVWFVVSPQNPFKKKENLARDYDRLHLVNLAIGDNLNLMSSNVEFAMPTPSYTIDTLSYLREKHPDKEFVLLMGEDNLINFHKWKNNDRILEDHEVYIYKRSDCSDHKFHNHPKIRFCEAPLLGISATYIRKAIQQGKSVQYLVPDAVYNYLCETQLYKK